MAVRKRQLDRTRAAIVDAAVALFAEQGFGPTTVEQIAERAGVSRRTFFRHFHAKEALLFHEMDDYEQVALDELDERLRRGEKPFVALVAALRKTADAVDREQLALLARIDAENDHLVEHHRVVVMRDFEQEVIEVICRGTGQPADSVAVAAGVGAILAAFSAAMKAWLLREGRGELAPIVEEAMAGVLDAVGSVSRRSARPR